MKSPTNQGRQPRQFHGIGLLIAMLREVDPIFRKKLLEKIRTISPIISRLAEHTSFIYRDIPRLDDRGIQLIFSSIPEGDWLIAWKLTDEKTRAFLLRNMSERRRRDFLEAAARQPKVLKRRVYAVQASIARRIHQMVCEGRVGLHAKSLRRREAS